MRERPTAGSRVNARAGTNDIMHGNRRLARRRSLYNGRTPPPLRRPPLHSMDCAVWRRSSFRPSDGLSLRAKLRSS